MNTKLLGLALAAMALFLVSSALAQRPGGEERGPGDQQGPRGGADVQRPDDRQGGPRKPGRRGPGGQQQRPRHPIVLALDADGDGEISAEEIAGAAEALKKLDKDGEFLPGETPDPTIRPDL